MSKFDNLSARSRYFRVLLYTDNPVHCKAFDIIKTEYDSNFVGIVHSAQDGEKEHIHIVLRFDNPRLTSTVCRALGFVDDLGVPDDQFVRAVCKQQKRDVFKQISSCCVYLIHKNAPEKEQYQISDLFGADDLIEFTRRQCLKYDLHEFDMPDSVLAVLDWISHQDDFIRVSYFGRWLANSPYWKANSNKVVWAALREHNLRIYSKKDWVPDGGFDTLDDFRELSDDEMRGLEGMGFVFGGGD